MTVSELHDLLDEAIEKTKEGDFVPAVFTQLCMEQMIRVHQVELKRRDKQIARLNASLRTVSGYGSDGAPPPWIS